MDLIEPISFSFGFFVAITLCYSVSDLVFSKDTNNEACDEN